MTIPIPGNRRRFPFAPALVAGFLAAWCPSAHGDIESNLSPLVVSATRMPSDPGQVGAAVGTLDPADLTNRGITDLRDALNEIPGVISTSTAGQSGANGSLFIRGMTTAYSQVVVDGIRLSDSTAPLGNFLSSADVEDLGHIEVLRGPSAALHGGEAVGGVLWLETARGSGDPSARLRAEAGSFSSTSAFASSQGQKDALSWFVGAGYDATANDAPMNDATLGRAAMRAEWTIGQGTVAGVTFRSIDHYYENLGTSIDHLDADLATVYLQATPAANWDAHIVAGYYTESYDSDSAYGNYGTDLERSSVVTDHVIRIGDSHRLLFGAFYEHTAFANTIGTDQTQNRYGFHTGWEWQATDNLTTQAALRWEDYDTFGSQTDWRAAAAWRLPDKATVVRASAGSAYRTPTLLDLYGTSYGPGNPHLTPETSVGWDCGIEHTFAENHQVSVTGFDTAIDNHIQSYPTPPVNIPGTTHTRGLETAAGGTFADHRLRYRLAWTYLDRSLQDMPHHTATASLEYSPSERWCLGVGTTYVGNRSYGGLPLKDYLLLRLYSRFRVNQHLTLHARIENALDQAYQLSRFPYSPALPGRGFGAFGGLTLEW